MLPELDEYPRTRIFAASPGAPEELMICTPAALPCRAAAASDVERLLSSDDFTEATEPVMSLLRCTP